jgi:hypothetical protein
MKTATLIIFILTMGLLTSLGQAPTPTPDSKEARKLEKERIKAEQEVMKEESKKRTVDFSELMKFPAGLSGRSLIVKQVGLNDLSSMTFDGSTYYAYELSNANDRSSSVVLANQVTFLSAEPLAKSVFSVVNQMRKGGAYPSDYNPLVEVRFDLHQGDVNGNRYYIAKVTCVGFYGFLSKMTYYGDCAITLSPSTVH